MMGDLVKVAVLTGVMLGSAVQAAAAERSGDALPRARAAAHRAALPRRAVTPMPEGSRLLGLPLFLGLGITAAVSAVVVAVATSGGDNDSEG